MLEFNVPVVIFCYDRLKSLEKTVYALKKNRLSQSTNVYIYSDGPKTPSDYAKVEHVRAFARTITGFKSVKIIESKKNKGLADSIIKGVTDIMKEHEAVIVLEDDLVTSTNFLDFMNMALNFYKNHLDVFSIAGYTPSIKPQGSDTYDAYFTRRASSWGWAIWRDRWEIIDWTVSGYADFKKDRKAKRLFNAMGSDLSNMLEKQMNGYINSWAIRACFHQYRSSLYSVFPKISKVANIGFVEKATHTKGIHQKRFLTELDRSDKFDFSFDPNPHLEHALTRQFLKPYTLITRIRYKLLALIIGNNG